MNSLASSQPECRKVRITMSVFSFAQGGTDRRVISKVMCVPVPGGSRTASRVDTQAFPFHTGVLLQVENLHSHDAALWSRAAFQHKPLISLRRSMLRPSFTESTSIREVFINSRCRGIYPDFVTECGIRSVSPTSAGDAGYPDSLCSAV